MYDNEKKHLTGINEDECVNAMIGKLPVLTSGNTLPVCFSSELLRFVKQ